MKLPETNEEVKSSGLRRDYFLNEILEFVGEQRGPLMDIGCGWGAFLDNAREQGFEVEGNEICQQMASFATNTLKIPVWPRQLENCLLEDHSAIVVTALHSLEHLPNQRLALSCIHNALRPDGWFCGIVPNFDSFMSQTQRDSWYWLDSNFHYTHYTPETLAKTLRTFGFNPVRIYTALDDFDPALINQQLAKMPAIANHKTIAMLETDGKGEAIRFFAQRA